MASTAAGQMRRNAKLKISEPQSWQSRLQAEFARLESRNRQSAWISVLAVTILIFAAASLFLHSSFWLKDALELKVPPPLLFVVLVLFVLLVLYLARRELEIRKLNVLTLYERLSVEREHSAGMVDPLTRVFNRRFLAELLQGEIARAERNQRPLTFVMCDLDRFKELNDSYGHPVGDEVLEVTAGVLKSCVRGSDYVVRYGGDEFLLILSETDETAASAVVMRVREKIAEARRLRDLGVSLSLGCYAHRTGRTVAQDIAEVDARLYTEKLDARTR
jgi:diguanylate cyclase (GGDEF)-like protein